MRQSEENRKAILTTSRESHRVPVGLPGLSACSYGSMDIRFSDYEPSLSSRKTGFYLEYLSGYLSVCVQKDVSGWSIFLGDFSPQTLKKSQNSCCQKQGKKYQYSCILSYNFTFSLLYSYYWDHLILKTCVTMLFLCNYLLSFRLVQKCHEKCSFMTLLLLQPFLTYNHVWRAFWKGKSSEDNGTFRWEWFPNV